MRLLSARETPSINEPRAFLTVVAKRVLFNHYRRQDLERAYLQALADMPEPLAPMLRELSEQQHARWLTLIAPPPSLTQSWLRDAGLNRERILLLQPNGNKSALQLTCEALRLGRSHN